MIKTGFMASLGFADRAPEEVCGTLASLGYDSVEWTLAHLDPRRHSATGIDGVVQATARAGLTLSEVVVQQDYVTLDDAAFADRVDFTLECLRAFGGAGIPCVNLFTGPAPWNPAAPQVGQQISQQAAWDRVWSAFDRIVPEAERQGIGLAAENVWGMLAHDFFSCRCLIDHYDSPLLGVNFDPSHDVLYGNTDMAWLIGRWGSRIRHCHIKDAAGVPEAGKFVFPLPGEGLVDWTAFFAALERLPLPELTCSVEFESYGYYERVLHGDIRQAAALSLDIIRQLYHFEGKE